MHTNKGVTVEVVAGDPALIGSRGEQIESLGQKMVDSASLLERIADGSAEGLGFTMDKLRDSVGDSHRELKKSGEMYKPTGPVLVAYATALTTAQTSMRRIVGEAEATERALRTAQDSYSSAQNASVIFGSSGPFDLGEISPEQEQKNKDLAQAAQGALGALTRAQSNHDENLDEFDGVYDTWWGAYEDAVSGIGDAIDGGPKDGKWDNFMGGVEFALEILKWVGLAVAVVALIVGGPILAIAALVIGVLTLVGTLILMMDGRRGKADLAWAVIGILPISKVGKLFGKGGLGKFAGEFGKQFTAPVSQLKSLKALPNAASAGSWRGAVANNFGKYVNRVAGHPPLVKPTWSGIFQRFVGGTNRTWATTFADTVDATGPKFKPALIDQLPKSLKGLYEGGSKGIPLNEAIITGGYNAYKWGDRAFSLGTTGRP